MEYGLPQYAPPKRVKGVEVNVRVTGKDVAKIRAIHSQVKGSYGLQLSLPLNLTLIGVIHLYSQGCSSAQAKDFLRVVSAGEGG